MNFGRFFKLNQNLSDMVAGVTIFDYTELPAYEGLASDNPSSPKYPITLTITDNAVRFMMHYCIYRCSNAEKEKQSDDSAPIYGFSIDDIKCQLHSTHPGDSYEQYEQNHNIVHIEEVILELPFTGFRASELTEIIKKSYIASFPQIYEKYKGDVDVSDDILTGNRFLDQLIEKELSDHNLDSDAISYSTLWLMNLYKIDGKLNLKGDRGLVDKFLRKLLLDFMFDLRHSNVFQACAEYDRMFSGLMTDYYFSALMHKCEYYYYRDLTTHAIKKFEEKKKNNSLQKNDEKKIVLLYAKELFDAEEEWANDIRNPLSEKFFEKRFPNDFSESNNSLLVRLKTRLNSIFDKYFPGTFSESIKSKMRQLRAMLNSILEKYFPDVFNDSIKSKLGQKRTILRSIFAERMTTKCWDSWFASPEEEMRRIYFPFKTYNNNTDICNSITLTEYFYNSPDIKELEKLAKESQGESSRWFLNRYDFNDVLHLHFFKHANIIFLSIAIFVLASLWLSESIERLVNLLSFSYLIINNIPLILLALIIAINLTGLLLAINHKEINNLKSCHYRYLAKKLWITSFLLPLVFLFIYSINNNKTSQEWQTIIKILVSGAFLFIIMIYYIHLDITSHEYPCRYPRRYLHPIKNGHLFLPKLTASIMTAWLTLSRGIQYFIPFFESYIFVLTLIIIVLGFIMYQVNKVCPNNSTGAKVFKTIEFFTISYCISLLVGLVVINYAGKHYLVEHGYLNHNYTEFVANHPSDIILYHSKENNNTSIIDMKPLQYNIYLNDDVKQYLYDEDNTIVITSPKYRPTVIRLPLIGSQQGILIIPRLWLMSSILAMFIGVFLQMLFFQEKQMTDI